MIALLPACNSVFGLHDVDPAATFFDAPVDASPTCPPIGTAPRFHPLVRQYVQQPCRDYAVSASGTAVALCRSSGGYLQVAIGVPGQPLALVPEATGTGPMRARLSTDDQRLYVADVFAAVREYKRVGSGWQLERTVTELGTDLILSGIARSPTGDRLVAASQLTFHEWERRADGTWSLLSTTLPTSENINNASLTTDGLRLIAETNSAMLYADRPDTSSSFGPPQVFDVPFFEDSFMTEDCARIYATGLGQIAYLDGE